MPRLRKSNLDPTDPKSYCPIANLTVLSKLLERLIARQLVDYLNESQSLPDLQSAYWAKHSTETAVTKVLSDILALDRGDLTMLTLLDLSSAFDSVDHETLLRRLEASFGIAGPVLMWFTSYLYGRTHYVRCNRSTSAPVLVICGVPQGSVLGPILFLVYTAELLRLIERHGLHPPGYADDTQIYGFCSASSTDSLQERISACIYDVSLWMSCNRLLLNTSKTEVLWCSTNRRQHQISQCPVHVGEDVTPSTAVRDLGMYIDCDASMKTHVMKTISNCFAALRQIHSVRRSVIRPVLLSLVTSLMISRLDYGNATLAGLHSASLPLQ